MADVIRPVKLETPQGNQRWFTPDGKPTMYGLRVFKAIFDRTGGYDDDVFRALGIGVTGLGLVNQVGQQVAALEASTAALQGAVAGLRGDPRLEDAVKALETAVVALVQVQARASGETQKQIGDVVGLVGSLGGRLTKAQQAIQFQSEAIARDGQASQMFITSLIQRQGALQADTARLVDIINDDLLSMTTDDLPEGITNLYYTDERTDDRVSSLIQNGGGITWTYNDGAGTLTPAVAIDNANWSGADLEIANGGTGASTASTARSNLGLAIGSDVQGYNGNLAALAGLSLVTDRLPYANGTGTMALATFTAFGRSLVDDADAAAGRTTLGLVIGTNVQAFHANLTAFAGLSLVADRLPYANGTGTLALATFTSFGRSLVDDADATAARATLGFAGNITIGGVVSQRMYDTGVNTRINLAVGGASTYYATTSHLFTIAGGATILGTFDNTGLDVLGLLRCDTFRIDATPTAAAVTQSHHVPINLNGTVYKLLLAS